MSLHNLEKKTTNKPALSRLCLHDVQEEFEPVEGQTARFHMDVRRWLEGDADYAFANWKKRLPTKGLVCLLCSRL